MALPRVRLRRRAHARDDLPLKLVGDDRLVPTIARGDVRYLAFDASASTPPLETVSRRVQEFLPWYSSVHRGAGYKSQTATTAYEEARDAALRFAGREGKDDIAIICRNTTDAINHLAYRLQLASDDVVVTTVVEHHANLLPWARVATRRFVECAPDGTFTVGDVQRALEDWPPPKLLAITGASNVTGWLPPLHDIIEMAHSRGVPVAVDAAQLAPHRPMPSSADYIAWSGHKMYAPYGAGVLIGPRETFAKGDPFLHGGGAVELVDLDWVDWKDGVDREEAGSPNVIGAVALHAAMDELERVGWAAIESHEIELTKRLRDGLAAIPGVSIIGPKSPTLAVATFNVEGMHHSLVAARLSAEFGIGVRHGCFCAHPYLTRLLGMSSADIELYREEVRAGDRSRMPGGVRASSGISTTLEDVGALVDAVREIACGGPPPVSYVQDRSTGDFQPEGR